MMEARLIFMALVCLCIAQMALAEDHSYNFKSPAAEQHFVKVLKGIRCSVCQNQSIFDSNSTAATELRNKVYTMYKSGLSKQQIYATLRQEYGDSILFMPPLKAQSASVLLWFGPVIIFCIGMTAFVSRYVRNRRTSVEQYA